MKKPWMATVGEYTSLAFLLPVSTLVGYAIGYLLDKAFGTHFLYVVFLVQSPRRQLHYPPILRDMRMAIRTRPNAARRT